MLIMQYSEKTLRNGETLIIVVDLVNLASFQQLTGRIEKLFSAHRKNISIPEAEISNIEFGHSRVYAKLDSTYGCELQCSGLTSKDLGELRNLLQIS